MFIKHLLFVRHGRKFGLMEFIMKQVKQTSYYSLGWQEKDSIRTFRGERMERNNWRQRGSDNGMWQRHRA